VRKREDFNWVGHWFTLAEQTGECSEIIFGEVRSEHTRLSRLSHIDYDGITGLIHLLRERGELHADFLPRLPIRSKPSIWVQLREALKIVFKGPVKARKWAVRNPAWREGVSSSETVAFSWHVLSAQETSMVIAKARSLRCSVNSLLFKALCDAVEPHLEPSSLPSVWIMPVSIHPEITVDTAPQNRSSYVDVYIPPKATPQEIEREVRRLEKKRAFWGVWLLMNLGRWLGEWVVKLMVKTNPKTQQKTGVFSNLGNWTGPSQVTSPSASAWFFMPPMVAFQPFAASALTWNGCLSLGVRLHPVLSTDQSFSQQLVERWRASLPRPSDRPAAVAEVTAAGDVQERRDVRF
jgi:hypothetical protein